MTDDSLSDTENERYLRDMRDIFSLSCVVAVYASGRHKARKGLGSSALGVAQQRGGQESQPSLEEFHSL